ncbi:MAG: glutathionylspermidine synthase family protein [Bacteroidales bacterium]
MKRHTILPRPDYTERLSELDFDFHSDYWVEKSYYSFTEEEIAIIEKDTNEIYEMVVNAAQHVIDNNLFHLFDIPEQFAELIKESWEADDPSIYGRFDFVFKDGRCHLLEFNADTPTSLYEASVVQWQWKEDLFPNADQYNAIHEQLLDTFRDIKAGYQIPSMHFACSYESSEDFTTTSYLQDLAAQSGINTSIMNISDIGWNGVSFTDPSECYIYDIFKLYPWEWLIHEEFAEHILLRTTNWFEPIWKMLMSNKTILPILHNLYPYDKRILPAFFKKPALMRDYAKKPTLSREGANVELVRANDVIASTGGEYADGRYIWQELCLDRHDGFYPIIGSWVIGGAAAGIGIRENSNIITDNMSHFVPHIIEEKFI